MSIHDGVRTAIGSLVGGRYYPTKFPQEAGAPTWPAIRGTVVSRANEIDQCGAGTDADDDVLLQLDICALTYDACDALRVLVCAAMATAGWHRQPGAGDGWDDDARVHRMRVDFLLQLSTP